MQPSPWQALILCLCGCGLVAGLDDFQPPLEGGSGGQGGATLPACDGGVCMPPIPEGWHGPVCADLYAPATGGTCGTVWTEEQHFGGVGEPGGEAQCESCTCGAASGGGCEVTLEVYAGIGCQSPVGTAPLSSVCVQVPSGNSGQVSTAWLGGSCTPSGGAVTLLPPVFENWARWCGLPSEPPACSGGAGGLCVPSQDNCSYCIWRDGDVPCPPGAYAVNPPVVVATATTDGRGCSPCTCTAATGGSCTTTGYHARLCNASQCNPLNCVDAAVAGGCVDSNAISYAQTSVPPVGNEGACDPAGGTPQGLLTIDAEVTLCCAT